MKNKLLFVFAVLLVTAQYSNATVHTVSNNINTPGQFTDLVVACNTAANGDTIYVHASNTAYGGTVSISKKLTIFGAGYNGKSYQFTNLGSSVTTMRLLKGASGTIISGLRISDFDVQTDTVTDVLLERNYFVGTTVFTSASSNLNFNTNWVVRHNIISGQMNASSRNNLIANNFINNIISQGTNIFTNNIIINNSNATPFGTVTNTIFSNNIFHTFVVQNPALIQGQTGNTFSNNIVYKYAGPVPGLNNTGLNNQVAVDPLYTRGYSAWINNYDSIANYDWSLSNASTGNNAGTDGTDIGIYGGNFPYPNLEGVTQLPQVKLMNIVNTTVPLNGNINVNVVGVKRD